MRFGVFIKSLLFGAALIGLGLYMFHRVSADQRKYQTRMASIRAGLVRPETLTVVRKYIENRQFHPAHVVYRSASGNSEIDEFCRPSFYETAKPGDRVTGYRFGDGYMIPKAADFPGKGGDYVKWSFLAAGLLMGMLVIVLGLFVSTRRGVAVTVRLSRA